MYSSNQELHRIRSKSCYSSSTHRPQGCRSSQGTFRSDPRTSDSCSRLGSIGDHTISIHEENVVNIDLPPLLWFGYNKTPKILSATNTGRTILVNGQWACGRPYITGGPLNGSYIFSQIHFHSPSEHEIDGRRYPLEMHVVHYKNSYLTQERAMKEKDGTVVLVYLFQVLDHGTTIISQVSKLASCLEKKNSRRELSKIPLDRFAVPFTSNYYTYRSAVPTDKSFYLLQWIINCNNLFVTRQEVDELLFAMNSRDSVARITPMQPESDIVFRVGEEDYSEWLLSSQSTEGPCCQQKNDKSKACLEKKPSKPCLCEKPSKKSVCGKASKKSVCEKASKKSVCEKPSKKSVCEKPSKKSVCGKSSKKSVREKSDCEKPSKTVRGKSVCEKASDSIKSKKASKTSVSKKCSKKSVCQGTSNTIVCKESSKTSLQETSGCENSSGMSCTSVTEKKVKKRKKCKIVDNATNTTPCCSKSNIKEKKKKVKKSKNDCDTKDQSTSASVEKFFNKSERSQTSVKKATACESKETELKKKIKRKSDAKSSKTKTCKSEEVKESDGEIHASLTTEKLGCSEANVKIEGESAEKIKTLYEKKLKCPAPPPPECNAECSNTAESIECAKIGDNNENNDEMCCDDVQINYLFMANTSSNVNVEAKESDMTNSKNKKSLVEKESTIQPKDFAKPPPHPNSSALVKAVKFPVVKPKETKNLYLHTKHIFRTEGDNKGFTPRSFQECHLLIERDHYVLQEYNGKLYPDQLSPGNYEQINLLARYPDPEDSKLQATECLAKLESQNELSIRAKFLILEPDNENSQRSVTFSTHSIPSDTIQKKKSLYDAQCQCDLPKNTKCFDEGVNTCKSLVKWDKRSMGVQSLDCKSTEILNTQDLNSLILDEVDSRTSTEDKNLNKVIVERKEEENLNKALVERDGANKHLKRLNTSGLDSETISKDSINRKKELEFDKVVDRERSDKSIHNSLSDRKKTTFFVYDRIEKDENSGKKIFVGSFRTRDEIEVLYKHRNIFQNDRISSDVLDGPSNSNRNITGSNTVQKRVFEKFPEAEDSQSEKSGSTWNKENTIKTNETKQLITLHKFKPKSYPLSSNRKKSKSIIVGKISSKVDIRSDKYSQLANMLGIDKTQRPKICFYEFKESDTQCVNNTGVESNSKHIGVSVKKAVKPKEIEKDSATTSERSYSFDGEFSEGLEGTSSSEKRSKSLDEKGSQAAVVIIPIEVESLSKVEIILIEHADDVKKGNVENKYNSYLKHYKRLIFKLKFSFL